MKFLQRKHGTVHLWENKKYTHMWKIKHEMTHLMNFA
jgi:hypothetical protein